MTDIKWIRANPEKLDHNLKLRGAKPMAEQILKLDELKREAITEYQTLQHARKETAQKINNLANKEGLEAQTLKKDANDIKDKLEELKNKIDDPSLDHLLDNLPNILDQDVPFGLHEELNEVIRTFGTPRKDWHAMHHQDAGQKLGMLDSEKTAQISGSRFATLTRGLAKLERALVNFMLDHHVNELDFVEVSPPYLVKDTAMYNVGLLPKFAQDSFEVKPDFRLIPTAEVCLTNMVADTIVAREALPIRMVAHTPCFRSEAGSAGRDTKGLIRMHQFSKVELVTITTPDESTKEHEYITAAAEAILKRLDLPYRVMLLCSGDTGFQSSKTYDLEVWMPAQSTYREISSCSNCKDFQSRRMKARYKEFGSQENVFLHTLNGSALAVGRTIAAILENYQNPDGSVQVPECLVPYMNGVKKIEPYKLNSTIIN